MHFLHFKRYTNFNILLLCLSSLTNTPKTFFKIFQNSIYLSAIKIIIMIIIFWKMLTSIFGTLVKNTQYRKIVLKFI
jgi:hypothetical protein